MGRRGFSKEIATDRDKAAGPRIRQRKHAFRFGARIEATRNPPPLPHAIATEMHRGATAARGHGERHARACDTGTAGGKRSLACLGPRAIGKQPPRSEEHTAELQPQKRIPYDGY